MHGRVTGQTDGLTDGHRTVTQTLPHTMRAVPKIVRHITRHFRDSSAPSLRCLLIIHTQRTVLLINCRAVQRRDTTHSACDVLVLLAYNGIYGL